MSNLQKVKEILESIRGYNRAAFNGQLHSHCQDERLFSRDKAKEALESLSKLNEDLVFLALIAYLYGDISIGKCKELTGLSDTEIRE